MNDASRRMLPCGQTAIRQWLPIGIAAVAVLLAAPAWAIGPSWQLPAGAVPAIGAERIWFHGRAASLHTFDAPGNIADVAVGLIAQLSTPSRLQPMPDGLLIAGVDGTSHWLVRLVAAGATRTRGSLSAIDMQQTPSLPSLAWQPAGTTVRMDVAADDGDVRIRQQVWTDPDAADAFHRRICGALRQHGWRLDDTGALPSCSTPLAWPATGLWHRDGATVTVVVDRHAPGSSAFVLQTDPLARPGIGFSWRSAVQGVKGSLGGTR